MIDALKFYARMIWPQMQPSGFDRLPVSVAGRVLRVEVQHSLFELRQVDAADQKFQHASI